MKIDISAEQFNVICAGLGKLPLEISGQTYATINEQASEQQNQEVVPLVVPDPIDEECQA